MDPLRKVENSIFSPSGMVRKLFRREMEEGARTQTRESMDDAPILSPMAYHGDHEGGGEGGEDEGDEDGDEREEDDEVLGCHRMRKKVHSEHDSDQKS